MHKIKTALVLCLVHLVGALPIAIARKLGRAVGTLGYWLNTRMARVTRTNTALCLPKLSPQEHTQLTKRSLQSTAMLAAEICRLFSRNPPLGDYVVGVEGKEVAEKALAEGKGLIVLAPHLGNWEVLGLYLTQLAKVTNLYQPPKMKGLEPLIRRARERDGATLVPTNSRGVSGLLKALRAGGICGILPDQNPNELKSGDFAPFFGQQALTMLLAHKLINKTGAKVVFAFAKRMPTGFRVIFRQAPSGIDSDSSVESLRALNQGVENLVLEAPEQYQWEYKRFKVRPDNAKPVY